MPRFLIEIPHSSDKIACAKVVRTFATSGSHFLTQADWGCADGDHRAWMVVELEDRAAAEAIVPPAFRAETRVTRLVKFLLDRETGRVREG
jgi:hypothetical protein